MAAPVEIMVASLFLHIYFMQKKRCPERWSVSRLESKSLLLRTVGIRTVNVAIFGSQFPMPTSLSFIAWENNGDWCFGVFFLTDIFSGRFKKLSTTCRGKSMEPPSRSGGLLVSMM